MKNIILFYVFICVLHSCESSCDDLTTKFLNDSGKRIEITSYKRYYPNIVSPTISKKFITDNKSDLQQIDKVCSPEVPYLDIGNLFEGDSIVIDFGDKRIRYGIKNLSSSRNPFYLALNNKDQYNFTYTLTPEDYANALP